VSWYGTASQVCHGKNCPEQEATGGYRQIFHCTAVRDDLEHHNYTGVFKKSAPDHQIANFKSTYTLALKPVTVLTLALAHAK